MSAGWTAYQLTELLSGLEGTKSIGTTLRNAVERIAGLLEAEVAAYVPEKGNGDIVYVGFRSPGTAITKLREAATERSPRLELPGVGSCLTCWAPVGQDDGQLVIARLGDDFDQEESNLLRAMGKAVGLALRSQRMLAKQRELTTQKERLIADLRERQSLIERLSRIQGKISRRAKLQDVLDSITAGACELLKDDLAALQLIDRTDPRYLTLSSSYGITPNLDEKLHRSPAALGVGGQAIRKNGLVVADNYAQNSNSMTEMIQAGLRASMSMPINEGSDVIGVLSLGSYNSERTYTKTEQEVLKAFAEHASIALQDATTLDAANQAFQDALTGLPNRSLFLDRVAVAISRRRPDDEKVTILFLDLDRFKMVNDSLGHAAGDEVLVAVGKRLQDSLRAGDTAARIGGDEFAILLDSGSTRGHLAMVIDRIKTALKSPHLIEGRELVIDASIGVAVTGDPDMTSEDLVRNADVAMYRAKKDKSSLFKLFEPGMQAQILRRLELEAALQHAIAHDEFRLYFQPIVDVTTNQLIGAEALIRWQDPKNGLRDAVEFLGLAEETGLIVAIGEWMLLTACQRAKAWHAATENTELTITVNLSARQLLHDTIVQQIEYALKHSGLQPPQLMLEVTEAALMVNPQRAIATLRQLRNIGVSLAIDDFGTGNSSLGYLQQLPIDVLKLAKPFVDALGSAKPSKALARGIVALGRNLNLNVVAEGVEDLDQHVEMQAIGCTLAQGHYYGQPVTELPDRLELIPDEVDSPSPVDALVGADEKLV